MLQMLIGLILFLGIHALQSLAPQWRKQLINRWGALGFKGIYSVISLLGLILLVQGYALARMDPVALWTPPRGMQHATILLMWVAMVLLVAAYVPGNLIKARLHHPMVLGTKTWALAHLLANNTLADLLLFGAFLAWSVALFVVSRRRDRLLQQEYPPGRLGPTWVVLALALPAWAVFAFWLHAAWIGVRPLGGA